MKIKPEALASQLQQLAPCYWVTGDEPLRRDDAIKAIQQAAHAQGYQEQQTFHVLETFDWHQFFASLKTQSLFAEKQLMVLKLWQTQLNATAQKGLSDYVQKPDHSKVLIIESERLTAAQRQQKWFQTLDKHSVIVQIWPLSLKQQYYWLADQLKQAGYKLNPPTLKWFNEQLEGNLLAARQVIEKLKLLHSPGHISDQALMALIESDARFDLFALNNAILQGNIMHALKVLTSLKQNGVELPLILWAINKELKLLNAMVVAYHVNGANLERLIQQYQIWKPRQAMMKNAIKRLAPEQLQNTALRCSHVDQIIKGQTQGAVWQHLTHIVCELTGTL